MPLRRLLVLVLLALAVPAAAAAHGAGAPPPGAPLALGEARFWPAGHFVSDEEGARAFPLAVGPGGARLRVALDTPSREDGFVLELVAPDGTATSESAANQFNTEVFVADPAPGAWTVRVVPDGATDASVRLRAKLETAAEAAAPRSGPRRALLPNLKAVPPYELGFVAPANPLNGLYPPDTVNPPLSAAGQEPVSCTADEAAPVAAGGAAARDCLRLTTGPINAGEGPFVKTFTFAEDLAAGEAAPPLLRGAAEQVVFFSDGTTERRPAGAYSFHTTHAHFHDEGILTYELFRVVGGRDGRSLEPAGAGTKSGFCPADQLIGEWRRFTQDAPGTFGEGDTATGNCFSPTDGAFALTRGWGDVYRWQRPGQYVEWAGNGDGHYVVRATVDKGDVTLESDETDNSAYALVKVVGRRVELIERGQGGSHLDPGHVVFDGFGPAAQDPFGGALPAAEPGPRPLPAEPAPAAAPAPAAPAPGAPAAPSTAAPPAATARRAAAAARVTGVRLTRRAVRLVLTRAAIVRVAVRRRGRTVAAVRRALPAGASTVRLRRRLARGGRYAVTVTPSGGRPVTRALRARG